ALGLVGSTALGLLACGSSFSCEDKGRCKNDVEPAPMTITQCQMSLDDPTCGEKAKEASSCEAEQPPNCGADGKTQVGESAACKMQHEAYTTCLTNKLLDGGGGG